MINEFDLVGRPYLWGANPCVRSVCVNDHSDGRKILIGTSCSEVIHYFSNVLHRKKPKAESLVADRLIYLRFRVTSHTFSSRPNLADKNKTG